MSYPPSKYSPEYEKPQKPENHSGCCGGGCPKNLPQVEGKKKPSSCCNVRYNAGRNRSTTAGR